MNGDKRTHAVTAKPASHACRNPSSLGPRDKSITTFIAFKTLKREPARPGAVASCPDAGARRTAAPVRRGLAAVTWTLLASAVIMPAAWAVNVIPNDGPAQAPADREVTTAGMPGWQITLIALGASLIAATAAVLLDRARGARQAASATTT